MALSNDQKKFYENTLSVTKREITELEGEIQEELAKVKDRLAELQTAQKAARQMYDAAYFPIVVTIWILGALGLLPRVKRSTQGEGHERRFFYGSVWAVCIAQPVLWLLWKILPHSRTSDALKLAVFLAIVAWVANLSRRGLLPRTRPILPGEVIVSD